MGNKRIYEVANDYGKPVNEVIDLLKKNNIEKINPTAEDTAKKETNPCLLLCFCKN